MKLTIIAGPYEADRIRRAAVSAGFETVAVEPGDSLSGWITASRPDVIILAPRMVAPDPVVALAKVRAVPRARVPIFLVGEAEEEEALRPLADGFFVRPVAAEDLLEQARAAVAARSRAVDAEAGSGPVGHADDARADAEGPPSGARKVGSGKTPPLRPLVAKPEPPPPPERSLFDRLAESIDADIDAEIREVARAVGALRPRAAPAAPPPPPRSGVGRRVEPDGGDDVIAELQRVGSVKTREIPDSVRAALEADDEPAPSPRAEAAGAEIDDAPALTPSRAVVKAAEDRARIDALHALVVEGDYFQILGVPRDARAHDIRSAYELLAAALAPDALDPSVAAERRAQLVVIREVLDEAARLLADDSLRARYRQHLPLPSDAPPA